MYEVYFASLDLFILCLLEFKYHYQHITSIEGICILYVFAWSYIGKIGRNARQFSNKNYDIIFEELIKFFNI